MEIKHSIEAVLIYATMAVYAAAIIACLARRVVAARMFILSALFPALSVLVLQGAQARHLPMQTMFEVFLCLAVAVPVISRAGPLINVPRNELTLTIDAVIGLLVLLPAGFVFRQGPQYLPPALKSPLFGPHVMAYMLAYIIYTKAALLAGVGLLLPGGGAATMEKIAYRLAGLGFPLLTAGLLLGAVWGKLAWGNWWNWDPKEMMSLACWAMYLFYFHWRRMVGLPRPRLNCIWLLAGFALILMTLLAVNLSAVFSGVHNYAS